jgi:hypothetical protein
VTAPTLSRREQARLVAAVDMIGRTGGRAYEVGYEDPTEDGGTGPVVWHATATHQGAKHWRTGPDPVTATELLLEDLIDGGTCTSCGRVTALVLDGSTGLGMPGICDRYRLGNKYVRSCS